MDYEGKCPVCGKATDSLKAYHVPTFMLFLWVGASFQHGTVVACPSCMRARLAKLTVINILPANLLWLLLLLPWYGISALRSFTRGHSKRALALLEAPPEKQYRSAAGAGAFDALSSAAEWHDDPALRGYFSPEAPDVIDAHFVLPHLQRTERLPVRIVRSEGTMFRATLERAPDDEPGLYRGLEVFVRKSLSHPPLVWVSPAAAANLESWSARCEECQFDLCYTPVLELARRSDSNAQHGFEPSPMEDRCAACGGRLVVERAKVRSFAAPHPSDYDEGFEKGLGERADRMWGALCGVAAVLSLCAVGLAGYSSESAGVETALFAAFPLGATFGGWRTLHWARRRGKPTWTTGVGALLGGLFLFGSAVVFFFGIFPAL